VVTVKHIGEEKLDKLPKGEGEARLIYVCNA
jgi:hypothetical protein